MASLDPLDQDPVTDRDRPPGVRGDVRVVGDHHDREPGRVQLVEQVDQRGRVGRVEIAGRQGALCSPDEVDEVMDRIVLETRRMGRLVDDMLRLARLGQHPGQSREPVDVSAVVTGCGERAAVADPARTWRVQVADGLTAVGDEELLRRAVDNLLRNVLVHTPGDTVGTITACADDDRITIEVGDDGPGVAPDKLPHIFERFYRAGTPSRRTGSGLGLAIAAEIASAHGGTAHAEPVTPHGLRITLTLPVCRQSGARSARELTVSAS
jgi:two-component system, OmpR family, sensor kinase